MVRVEKMFEEVQSKLPGQPQFILCILPERKNSDLYGKVYLRTLKYKYLSEDEVDNFICVSQVLGKERILQNLELLLNVLLLHV